jgi:hypothetical protein
MEHGLVGGFIDRLSVIVMYFCVSAVIIDKTCIADDDGVGQCPTRPDNTIPGTGIVTTLGGGTTVQHCKSGVQ